MPAAQVFPVQAVFEDSGAYLLARIRGTTGSLITQASLTAINLRVYESEAVPESSDADDPAVVAARDLVISSCVFDTLQTDSGWDTAADPDGFNLKVEILPADLPKGGKNYRFEIKFTNASDKVWHFVAAIPTEGLYRS